MNQKGPNVNYRTNEEILTDCETQPLCFDHSGYVVIHFDSFLMVLREEGRVTSLQRES